MLSKSFRFHGEKSLKAVYRDGKTVRGSVVSLKYKFNNRRNYRVAVVVSKKVHKSAVVRNRIRRRIFEICRKQTEIDLTNLDLVFTGFSAELATIEHQELQKKIIDLLHKATTPKRPQTTA